MHYCQTVQIKLGTCDPDGTQSVVSVAQKGAQIHEKNYNRVSIHGHYTSDMMLDNNNNEVYMYNKLNLLNQNTAARNLMRNYDLITCTDKLKSR